LLQLSLLASSVATVVGGPGAVGMSILAPILRATGIAEDLSNGSKPDIAQRILN
jgi:hypothetical protein